MNGNDAKKSNILMGVDAGLAKTGVAIVAVPDPWNKDLKEGRIITAQSFVTRREDTKVRRSDEMLKNRIRQVAGFYLKFIETYKPRIISLESMSYPRNAASSAMLGMAWSSLYTLAFMHNIPVFIYSPREVRDSLVLPRNASKKDIEFTVREAFTDYKDWPKGNVREHAFDATAVIMTFLNDENWCRFI